ncbi:unnamed protein product [Spirodela intermedia]|uniref:Uncharacterized protein n=1 Tax=Spirodela intermedia TaxID=51605 RepID=A0A7I8IU34_SPIIN|nr:unnamed protein product [Spirodela intermedia]CAA6660648.1 unnamed protein product [Spirodela intermedia]
MYYKGVYHLFYQYNPKGAVWGNIVWAHSVSTDLVNWTPLEPAIFPSEPFDVNGCWSGSATILPGDKPVILYTGVDSLNRQVQNIAFPKNLSDPFLREWVKPGYNPVIAPDAGVNASAFRDPTTAWMTGDGHWHVAVGSKRGQRGTVVLYRSRDFIDWVKAKHPLHSAAGTGMWECPISTGGAAEEERLDTSASAGSVKHVLKVSLDVTRYDYYTVGKYYPAAARYVPDSGSVDDRTGLRYDYGNFYASKTFFDPAKNRRILWGWSNESDSRSSDVAKGWAGVQTIPRSVWLDDGGEQLVQWPVEELETLRGKEVRAHNVVLRKGRYFEINGIRTSQVTLSLSLSLITVFLYLTLGFRMADRRGDDVRGEGAGEGRAARRWLDGRGVAVPLEWPRRTRRRGAFGLWVLASGDLRERTAVFFRVFRTPHKHVVLMCHDPTRSTTAAGVWKPSFGGLLNVDIKKDGKISLRTLIDASVVESFGGGGRTCITSRVYPVHAVGDNAHLFAFNNGEATVKVSQLRAWQMGSPAMN